MEEKILGRKRKLLSSEESSGITFPCEDNSVLFDLTHMGDRIGIFPKYLKLGIDEDALHFYKHEHKQEKELVRMVLLKDLQFYNVVNNELSFNIRVPCRDIENFEFKIEQGEEIKAAFDQNSSMLSLPKFLDVYCKCNKELSKSLEEEDKTVEQAKMNCLAREDDVKKLNEKLESALQKKLIANEKISWLEGQISWFEEQRSECNKLEQEYKTSLKPDNIKLQDQPTSSRVVQDQDEVMKQKLLEVVRKEEKDKIILELSSRVEEMVLKNEALVKLYKSLEETKLELTRNSRV